MATATPVYTRRFPSADTASSAPVPWYLWCAAVAVTSVMIGAHWDISWHSSIGRDTFWTPAHMAIYLCGVLSGVAFGYLILSTTFNTHSPLRSSSVHIWGFRGPLGAFIASWGGITMLTSAPFDDWWHSAYGLDVKIVSPPHILLFIGVFAVLFGTLVLIAGHANRLAGAARQRAIRLFLYVSGIALVMLMVLLEEYTNRELLHSSVSYIAISVLVPMMLAMSARGSGARFGATVTAGVYTLAVIGCVLILPRFPAEPKLGPVFQHVTQFTPPQFPVLVIAPALALDFLWSRLKWRNLWAVSAVSAIVFLAVLLAVEWPFSAFLNTPDAHNWFFGTIYLSYRTPPGSFLARNMFWVTETAGQLVSGLGIALVAAFLSVRAGLSRGNWLRGIQR